MTAQTNNTIVFIKELQPAYSLDKDCLTDLQVFFTDRAQPVIDNAMSIKCKEVEIITVYLDVEPVPFNKGFYAVDLTFFFKVTLGAFSSPAVPPATVVGVAAFSKKVILYGSDGNVKVYCSTDPRNCCEHDNTNMPKASVQVSDHKKQASHEKKFRNTLDKLRNLVFCDWGVIPIWFNKNRRCEPIRFDKFNHS